jgi:hypothetical protein
MVLWHRRCFAQLLRQASSLRKDATGNPKRGTGWPDAGNGIPHQRTSRRNNASGPRPRKWSKRRGGRGFRKVATAGEKGKPLKGIRTLQVLVRRNPDRRASRENRQESRNSEGGKVAGVEARSREQSREKPRRPLALRGRKNPKGGSSSRRAIGAQLPVMRVTASAVRVWRKPSRALWKSQAYERIPTVSNFSRPLGRIP